MSAAVSPQVRRTRAVGRLSVLMLKFRSLKLGVVLRVRGILAARPRPRRLQSERAAVDFIVLLVLRTIDWQ